MYKFICSQQVIKSSDKSAKHVICLVKIIQCLSKCLLYFANVGQWLLILLGFSQFSLVTVSVLEHNLRYSKPLSSYNIQHTKFDQYNINIHTYQQSLSTIKPYHKYYFKGPTLAFIACSNPYFYFCTSILYSDHAAAQRHFRNV